MIKAVVFDPKASAKAEVVKAAKDMLERAEAGEFVDLAFAATSVDGGIYTGITSTEDAPRRLAAVSRLLFRLNRLADESGEIA
jgi:hypothetical protein